MEDFFTFRKKAIRYTIRKTGRYNLHIFGNLLLKAYEENNYHEGISEIKRINFSLERVGKIAILKNAGERSKKVSEPNKFRNGVEKPSMCSKISCRQIHHPLGPKTL